MLDYGLVDADHVQKITLFNIDEDARFACMSDHALLECEVLFQTSPKAENRRSRPLSSSRCSASESAMLDGLSLTSQYK